MAFPSRGRRPCGSRDPSPACGRGFRAPPAGEPETGSLRLTARGARRGDRLEAAGPQLTDQARDVRHVALEAGGAAADVVALVGVAGGDGGQAEAVAELPREGVLALGAAAVQRLHGADVAVGGVGGGALQRLRPVAVMAEVEGELAAVGVSGDEGAAGLFDKPRQLRDAVHPVDVAVDAEGEEVAVLRVDLDGGDDSETVAAGEVAGRVRVPGEVVLGEADGVEAGGLGGLDQVVGGEERVVGEGLGVGVEVDEHCGMILYRISEDGAWGARCRDPPATSGCRDSLRLRSGQARSEAWLRSAMRDRSE